MEKQIETIKQNVEKIKSGDILEVAEVVRSNFH